MKRAAIAGCGAIAVLILAAFQVVDVYRKAELQVLDGDGIVKARFELPDGVFDHVYLHSVHRSPVAERFRVESDGCAGATMRLYELRFRDSGVGMPSEVEGGYRLEGDTFVLAMNRSFKTIPLRVSPVVGHGLSAGGVFHPFLSWAAVGRPLVLSATMRIMIRMRR
jgi:hypothetical protein